MKTTFKEWIKAAGIRALKTVAQTAIAAIGTTALFDQVNWAVVASAAVMAGILSLLTSIAGLPELDKDVVVITEELAGSGMEKKDGEQNGDCE